MNAVVPRMIKVIKEKQKASWWKPQPGYEKFYSSMLDDKQYIYSFLDSEAAVNCCSFLEKYREVHKRYPALLDSKTVKYNKNPSDYSIYLEDETLESLKIKCLLNGIGLIGITSFNYTCLNKFFDLNISSINLLESEEVSISEQIDNLNYLLDF